ncbi:MAG: LysE family transporter [Methanomassiliicoccus sp.]|nr:LysE family transporter [Methanomassiliicoccus sp.]
MELELIFLTAFVMEIIFCAIPGALTAEALRRGVQGGYHPALMVQIGAIVGDTLWVLIALFGMAFLFEGVLMQLGLGILGGGFMLYLAWSAFKEARKGGLPEGREGESRGDFLTGALISIGNPFQAAFWLGIGVTTIALIAPEPQLIHYVVFMMGFEAAAVAWCFLFAYVVSVGRRFVTPRAFQLIEVVCGLFLVYLSVNMIWSTLHSTGLI